MDRAQLTPPPHKSEYRSDVRPAANADSAGNGHAAAEDFDHDRINLNVHKPGGAWIIGSVVAVVIVLGALLAVGLLPRLHQNKELAADATAAENAPIQVNVTRPHRAPAVMNVALPGTLRPWQEVSIFARTTGYLKGFYVDISEQVKKGQLMAEIDSPEVDQQLRGAKATLLQFQAAQTKAESDLELAEATWKRFETLKGTSGITQLELDQYKAAANSARAGVASAKANVASGEAEVQRLTELQGFEKVTAPFSGVVTGRTYDVGAMIIANPTSLDIKPMFKIAMNDVLRVFVNVPQSSALMIKKGMDVKVAARERPGRTYMGKVMGTTNYLDPTNRSLLTEIKVDNQDLSLLPGMYVDASFSVVREKPPLIIPAPALVTGANGNQVALVEDGKIHFRTIELGVDYGKELEIVGGLEGDEQIVTNPGERTNEGVAVRIATVEEPPQSAPATPDVPTTQPIIHEKVAAAGKP